MAKGEVVAFSWNESDGFKANKIAQVQPIEKSEQLVSFIYHSMAKYTYNHLSRMLKTMFTV